MGYTTILLHCDTSRTLRARTEVAADFAGRFGAHVIGLHVRPRFETPMLTDRADHSVQSTSKSGARNKPLVLLSWIS